MTTTRQITANQIIRRIAQEYQLATVINLPPVLLNLIVEYWFPVANGLRCPSSGEILSEPVVILHPRIVPQLYNRQSVIDAIAAHELERFGIDADNQDHYIFNQPGINFSDLNGIVDILRNNGSHLSLSFEIERERRSRGDILQPLFSSRPIIGRMPDFSIENGRRSLVWTPMTVRIIQFLGARSTPLLIMVMLVHRILGKVLPSSGNISFILAVIAHYSRDSVIQYKAIQYLSTNRNYIHSRNITILRCVVAVGIFMDSIAASLISFNSTITFLQFEAVLIGIMTAFPHLATSDLLLQDILRRRSKEQIKSLAIFLPLALLMLGDIIYKVKENQTFYNANLFIALGTITAMFQLPFAYLSVRETANTLADAKKYIRNPNRLLQSSTDAFAEKNESIPVFTTRNLLRLFASLSAGFLAYVATENPLAAILALCAVYMQGSLMYGIGTVDNRYRLLPRPIVEVRNDEMVPLSRVSVTPLQIEEDKSENKEDKIYAFFSDAPREHQETKRSLSFDLNDEESNPLLPQGSSARLSVISNA